MPYERDIFYDHVRPIFGGTINNAQVQGMNALMDFVDHFEWWPVDPQRKFFTYWNAYVFATAKHETAHTMQPIKEMGSSAYLQGKPYWPYIGRGFVQITWRRNYARSDRELREQNLIRDPSRFPGGQVHQEKYLDQALDLEVAGINIFRGMHQGWFTSHKLWDHLTNKKKDYFNARKIVNGLDKAGTIAAIAEEFEDAFVAAWVPEGPIEPEPPVDPEPGPDPDKVWLLRETAEEIIRQLQPQMET